MARRAPVVRVLFPSRIEDSYRRRLNRRVSAANSLLTGEMVRVLAQVGPDLNERARADSASTDLAKLLRVVTEVERAFTAAFDPTEGLLTTAGQVDSFATKQQRDLLKTVAGIDIERGQPALGSLYKGWLSENVKLIKSIDARYFDDIRDKVYEAVRTGRTTRELAGELRERYQVSQSRAELIARDQIGTLNAKITETRQRSVGVKRYRWVSSHDERVRPEHRAPIRDGNIYAWDDPPEDGHAGVPIACRCGAVPVFDDEEWNTSNVVYSFYGSKAA